MTDLKRFLKKRADAANAKVKNDELKYNEVPGQENLVVVSFYENGSKQSVQLETFSDEQVDFFKSLKDQVASFSTMSPSERANIERKLFALE